MLVRRGSGSWEQPPVRAYTDEAELQTLIAESPQLVAADGDRSAVVLRELALPGAGSLDVLVVHRNGELTLVEAKLNRNPEIRRAVVGQLLGYAGGLWRLGYDRLDHIVRNQHGASLADLAAIASADDPFDADDFRRTVARNLDEGTFRLVFAVDEITEDLKRAVEYLNAHTVDGTTAVVLELDYSKVGDIEILVPQRDVATQTLIPTMARWAPLALVEPDPTPYRLAGFRMPWYRLGSKLPTAVRWLPQPSPPPGKARP